MRSALYFLLPMCFFGCGKEKGNPAPSIEAATIRMNERGALSKVQQIVTVQLRRQQNGQEFQTASVEEWGYRIELTVGPDRKEFTLHARPIEPGTSGRRHFFADGTGEIRSRSGADAGPSDPVQMVVAPAPVKKSP